jgi:diacylglycerol kinase (ATP)
VLDFFSRHGLAANAASSNSTVHLRDLAAKAIHDSYRDIVVLGGDGAFHHVAEASFGGDVTLGFLPAGSGNDIASGLGLPDGPLEAARVYLESKPRMVDAVRIRFGDGRKVLCFGSGGLGLDAEAARLANGPLRWLPGAARYLVGALWKYLSFRPVALEAQIDGKQWSGEVLIAAVANVPNYGAGVRIAPEARANDGWLDLVLICKISWMRIAPVISAMLKTGQLRPDEIERIRARHVSFRTDRPVWFQGDGEVLGQSPLEAEILSDAIRVVAPISSCRS